MILDGLSIVRIGYYLEVSTTKSEAGVERLRPLLCIVGRPIVSQSLPAYSVNDVYSETNHLLIHTFPQTCHSPIAISAVHAPTRRPPRLQMEAQKVKRI